MKFFLIFGTLDNISFVKKIGRSCHPEYRRLVTNAKSLLEANEECFSDKQCMGIASIPCDETIESTSQYYRCLVGYDLAHSQTECLYEKTGNFFSIPGFSSSFLDMFLISSLLFGKIYFT